MPDTKNCFWNLTYISNKDDANIMKHMHQNSPLRIQIQNISGLQVYIFDSRNIYLEANEQNITDDDNPYYDINIIDFYEGRRYYLLALKDQDSKSSDFVVQFQIQLTKTPYFIWFPQEDLSYLIIAAILLITVSIISFVFSYKVDQMKFRRAILNMSSNHVKAVQRKKPGQKKKRQLGNPYINQQNPDNNKKPDSGSSYALKEITKTEKFQVDDSVRMSLVEKKDDSFFSGEDDGNATDNANQGNENDIINNRKLGKKIDTSQSKQSQPTLNIHSARKRRQRNYQVNTNEISQQDFNLVDDTRINSHNSPQSKHVQSFTANSPQQKMRQQTIREFAKSQGPNYKEIWEAERSRKVYEDNKGSFKSQGLSTSTKSKRQLYKSQTPSKNGSTRSLKKQPQVFTYAVNQRKKSRESQQTYSTNGFTGFNNINGIIRQQNMKKVTKKKTVKKKKTIKQPLNLIIKTSNLPPSTYSSRSQNRHKSEDRGVRDKQSPLFETKSNKDRNSENFSDSRSASAGRMSSPTGSISKSSQRQANFYKQHSKFYKQQQLEQQSNSQSQSQSQYVDSVDKRSKSLILVAPLEETKDNDLKDSVKKSKQMKNYTFFNQNKPYDEVINFRSRKVSGDDKLSSANYFDAYSPQSVVSTSKVGRQRLNQSKIENY